MNRLEIEAEIEATVDALGYELVAVDWGGSKRRPLLRIRVDRPDADPQTGVTVDDCAVVSRAVEERLEAGESVPERYVLEVSSPGVDRPLVRLKDWQRFAGSRVVVKGKAVLVGDQRRVEGELLGTTEDGTGARIRLDGGEEVLIPLERITSAHLVYTWS
jgi:ribosome maturation factor RimP